MIAGTAVAVALIGALLASGAAPSASVEGETLRVPAALLEVTSAPELSGLAWSAALGRWLAVTDDTGREEKKNRRAPWVLAVDAAGALDAAPVELSGVAALDDAEAICPGPEGTFFLLTSHSPNKAGKTPPERRQLLWLGLEERKLVVRGVADLSGALAQVLPFDARPDLEGLGFKEGKLYVGLKEPLSEGKAQVLELAGGLEAFSGKPPTLAKWKELPLCVEGVCQGVSDLLFLPDGTLLLASNAPKSGPKGKGGALWRVEEKGGAALVRSFPGLKPEGLGLSPGRDAVQVVFDTGGKAPRWLRMPLESLRR